MWRSNYCYWCCRMWIICQTLSFFVMWTCGMQARNGTHRQLQADHSCYKTFHFWTMLCTRVPATQWAVDRCVPGCPATQWPVHHCVPGCPATQWPIGRCVPGCPATQWPVGRCAAGRPDTDTQCPVERCVPYPGARSRSQFEPTTMLWN